MYCLSAMKSRRNGKEVEFESRRNGSRRNGSRRNGTNHRLNGSRRNGSRRNGSEPDVHGVVFKAVATPRENLFALGFPARSIKIVLFSLSRRLEAWNIRFRKGRNCTM